MPTTKIGIAGVVSLLLLASGPATLATAAQPSHGEPAAPIATLVVEPPSPVPGTDRARHLAYEILLRNVTAAPLRIERVDVVDAGRFRTLATYSSGDVERVLLLKSDGGTTPTNVVPPGAVGLLVLDVRLHPGEPVPAGIEHRFVLVPAGGASRAPRIVTAAPTPVSSQPPAMLGAPLRLDNLLVLGCCGLPFTHRDALSGSEQDPAAAQRYAVDFVQVDEELRSFAGDPTRNESYFIYGADVSAVGPGRVLAIRDGLPENSPGFPAELAPGEGTGNFVIQDLDDGRLAVYAHLRSGSVNVRPGNLVARGQKLGAVGNNGRSTAPHLHLHVMDAAGEGLPYVFDRFRLDRRIVGLDRTPPLPILVPAPPPERTGQLPLTGDIISFI